MVPNIRTAIRKLFQAGLMFITSAVGTDQAYPWRSAGASLVLASNSATIFSAGPINPGICGRLVFVFLRVGVEIEQQWYAELLSRRNHRVLLVKNAL
jgi:hypothetical protein